MRIFASVALAALAAVLFTIMLGHSIANAQEEARRPRLSAESRLGTLINQNTLAIVSGNVNATYLSIAYDLSAVLDDGDNLRILPVIGKGGGQNIRDVRFLKGVDLGITQSILLNTMQRTKEIGSLNDKLVYIAKLFNEEMHLIVRADSGITSIEQLRGKTVNFSDVGSGTQLSTRDIFTRLAIPVTEVNMGQADAFEKLKSGEIAATILIAGKPAGAMARLRATDGFRMLPVPYAKQLHDEYLPTTIGSEDYPLLIEAGQSIESIAVSAVLFAYNWPADTDRYRRIAKFVEAFFPRLAEFQKPPRHPKWRETNLAALLPGWTRFAPAEAWLRQHRAPVVADQGRSEQFSAARGVNADAREQLFLDFLKWNQTRNRGADSAPGKNR